MQACTWTSGFPFRSSFARGRAEHDPWRFDAARVVQSGEADAAVWIAATEPLAPSWDRSIPTIAIGAPGTSYRTPPDVEIAVGQPGTHHPAVLFDPDAGTLVAKPGMSGLELPAAGDVLRQIAGALEGDRC
jgi:formylmethanofuran dehydrogenase subunit B